MDAWTAFGLVKLFLEILGEGPQAIVKGILMLGVPSPFSEALDIGEVLFGLFNLEGNYQGTVVLNRDQKVPFSKVELLNREHLDRALADIDFQKIARREFAKMEKLEFSPMDKPDFKKRQFPKL